MLTYDRIKSAVTTLVRQLTAKYDYGVTYSAVVTSQNSDGTVNVKPDSESLQYLPQVPNVKVVYDSPGTEVELEPGCNGVPVLCQSKPGKPAVLWLRRERFGLLNDQPWAQRVEGRKGWLRCAERRTDLLRSPYWTSHFDGSKCCEIGFMSYKGVSLPSPADFIGSGKLTGVVMSGLVKLRGK